MKPCPCCHGLGEVPDAIFYQFDVGRSVFDVQCSNPAAPANIQHPTSNAEHRSEEEGNKSAGEKLDARKPAADSIGRPPAASLASFSPNFPESSAKLRLRQILEGDPDFDGWVRDVWEKFLTVETDQFCSLLVTKYERHQPRRPGAYLSAVAKAKGRWVKAA